MIPVIGSMVSPNGDNLKKHLIDSRFQFSVQMNSYYFFLIGSTGVHKSREKVFTTEWIKSS